MIKASPLPVDALLQRYAQTGGYTDAYRAEVPAQVPFDRYVAAFYCTPLFKIERGLLALAIKRGATDQDADALGAGTVDHFAAWRVEARVEDQLLLCDYTGRTRSWLHAERRAGGGTWLWFGSAVVPRHDPRTGQLSMGLGFSLLLGIHRLYSRALLASAVRALGNT